MRECDVGLNERRCIARGTLGLYGSIVTVATYNGSKSPPPEPLVNIIVRALKHCITEHPVLCTTIPDAETEKPQLASVSLMDLRKHMRFVDNSSPSGADISNGIQPLLEQVHNEPFTHYEFLPPWRIYVVPLQASSTLSSVRFRIALASSHALADGMSGLAFHSSFLKALNQIENLGFNSDPVWTVPPSRSPILPPLEIAVRLPISWSFLLRPALNEYLPSWITNILGIKDTMAADTWCGAAVRPKRNNSTELLHTGVRTAFVSQKTMRRVLKVCRAHHARLTGLLTQITARALAQGLRPRGQYYNQVVATIAIDLRKCIPEAKNHIANYNSSTNMTLAIPENIEQGFTNEEWEAVRHTTNVLADRSSTLADQPVALLKYLSNIRPWVLKQALKPSDVSFGISNLGVVTGVPTFNTRDGRGWAVEAVAFSQSADGTGQPLNVNVASIEGGPMTLIITWWPGMLGVDDEDAFVEEVVGSIVHQLDSI